MVCCSPLVENDKKFDWASRNFVSTSVADPYLELREGRAVLIYLPCCLSPSVISSFFTQNKGGCHPPGPSPRSATAHLFSLSKRWKNVWTRFWKTRLSYPRIRVKYVYSLVHFRWLSVYFVCSSVSSLNNLKLHRTKAVKRSFMQWILIRWLTLYWLALTGFPTTLLWDPFLEGSEKFSYPESSSKISNLIITELFYSQILNMNRGSLHTRRFCRIHQIRVATH